MTRGADYPSEKGSCQQLKQYGTLSRPENEFSIYFAHVAQDQCSMRLDLESARAWVIFQER